MRKMLSAVMVGLLMMLCLPSLAAVDQSGYLAAPDAVLAVVIDQRSDHVKILSRELTAQSQSRICSAAGKAGIAGSCDHETASMTSQSPGGATPGGTLRRHGDTINPVIDDRLRDA